MVKKLKTNKFVSSIRAYKRDWLSFVQKEVITGSGPRLSDGPIETEITLSIQLDQMWARFGRRFEDIS